MRKDQKATIIEDLTEQFAGCDTVFVADYRGLDVPGITALRERLREVETGFRVVKNTLARAAAEKAGYDGLAELLVGPSAVTFVKGDPISVAKVLDQLGRETKILKIKGGLVDGRLMDDAQVKEMASLGSRETVLAMLVGSINAPLSQFVGVLSAPPRDIVSILDAYIEKRQKEEGA